MYKEGAHSGYLHCGGGNENLYECPCAVGPAQEGFGNKFLWRVVEVSLSWWRDARAVQTAIAGHCLRAAERREAGKKGKERGKIRESKAFKTERLVGGIHCI